MAACTRSGARKASEIVMLTLRMLHRSRLAMLSAFAFASARSWSSQRRPRAIDDEFKITPAMMDAGVDAFRLFDRATDPEYVVWAVYQDMMKVAVAIGVVEVKCPAHLPGGLSGDVRT